MKLGKRRRRFDKRIPALAKYSRTKPLAEPPPAVDWALGMSNWTMAANDNVGDCTCAAVAHVITQWTALTRPAAPVIWTDAQVLGLYSAITGYRADDPATDLGAVETEVLDFWLKSGWLGDQLTAFAAVNTVDPLEVRDAIHWFGNIYIGLALPASAQDQEVWRVPDAGPYGSGDPGSWGGHAVPVMQYDADGLTCVTWGAKKRMSWGFFATYCDEAYALLSTDFIDAAHGGKSPGGIDWGELVSDMAQLKADD